MQKSANDSFIPQQALRAHFVMLLHRPSDAGLLRSDAHDLYGRCASVLENPRQPTQCSAFRNGLLGETITPFRLLEPVTAVIPMKGASVLTARTARDAGHRYLAAWMHDVEGKWAERSNKKADGQPRMTLAQQIDHMRKLSIQAGQPAYRVLYTASGKRLSALRINADNSIVEHKAYWATAKSIDEALYVEALLNSNAVLAKISDLQPRGEFNPRDFDNLVWTLPIPEFDPTDQVHLDLTAAAVRAEAVAVSVRLTDTQHFTAKRRAVRAALAEDGVTEEIEQLVDALLPP